MDEGGLHDSLCEEILILQKENTQLKAELAQCQQREARLREALRGIRNYAEEHYTDNAHVIHIYNTAKHVLKEGV